MRESVAVTDSSLYEFLFYNYNQLSVKEANVRSPPFAKVRSDQRAWP